MLDVMMPEMDGYETCQKIKANPDTQNLPVIFLTAKTEPEDITKGFNSGGIDYITKPFNAEELLSRVKTHIELKLHRQELEKLVLERTRELDEVNKQLEKANADLQNLDEAKNEFINIISHEIRTPLKGILGPIQLMNMDQKGELSLRMNILNESVERLEQFSHKMILLSELRAGRYKFQKRQLQMMPVINDVLAQLKNLIDKKRISIVLDDIADFKMNSDEYLLTTLLFNLIENAINASKEAQRIFISNEVSDTAFIIKITDEAGGMSEDLLRQVFKPFITGGKFVNKNMGLGLYLSKLIGEVLTGSLKIENIGKGLNVNVKLNF